MAILIAQPARIHVRRRYYRITIELMQIQN